MWYGVDVIFSVDGAYTLVMSTHQFHMPGAPHWSGRVGGTGGGQKRE